MEANMYVLHTVIVLLTWHNGDDTP